MDEAQFHKVAKALLDARWIFARTMPEIPHWYTLRREWDQMMPFDEVVLFIRANGYVGQFYEKSYLYLDIDDMCYWTMGEPLEQTILINRAHTTIKK